MPKRGSLLQLPAAEVVLAARHQAEDCSMRLGLITGYSGRTVKIAIEAIKHAETLGYDSVWTSEAYGSDAVTPAAWILAHTSKIRVGTAIMQMPARTPAMAAMTAMTLAQLSGGRFIVGLGASGPQVVEGWHGVAYGRPVTRLRCSGESASWPAWLVHTMTVLPAGAPLETKT